MKCTAFFWATGSKAHYCIHDTDKHPVYGSETAPQIYHEDENGFCWDDLSSDAYDDDMKTK